MLRSSLFARLSLMLACPASLPASMLRVIRRPGLEENLEIFFKNYQVNQPFSEDTQTRFKGL